MHAVIHRSIVTFYLCWNLVNSHPPVFTNKATEMEINTPDGPEYSYYKLMNWAYFFEMVKIQNCGDLLKSADDSFPHQVKKLLMEREWSPKLVDDLVKKYNQSNWPPGISDEEICNDEKERLIKNYICRRIPGFLEDNQEEAVIVLAADNPHMPADTIAEPGFLMFLKKGALYYTNDDKLRGLEKCFDIVEVLRWDLLITSPDNSLMESAHHQLIRQNWHLRHVYSIIGKYSQNNWPSGILGTQLHDGEKMSLLKNYICRRIPSVLSGNQEEAVIVFASDNMHMPADMIAHPGFLMAFKQGALYSLGYDEFKSVPDTLESVQISRWGLLLTSPDNYLWDRVNSLLFKRKIPYRLTRAILERYSKTNWPLGTLSALLQYDEEKKMLLNKYICRRIPGILSDNKEEALIVFASDNTHMPLDMIVEPGFLMMFNPAINMEIDRPHFSDYSIHNLMKWVYYFEKVKIQNCGYLLTSVDDSFTHQVKNVLIKRMWSTQLVDELVEKYNLSTWPSGISSEEICNDEKERRIKNYNCRRIPGFLKGNREEAVIVLAIDNPHMPADTITKPGFMMFLNPGALYYSNDDKFKCAENCFDIVEVLRWDLLITSPDNSLMDSVDHQLLRKNWSRSHVEAITGRYSQNSWPSGISGTQLHDGEKISLLKKYICRRIPSVLSCNQEEAVIVFAFDNTHMPADMIAHPGFLMAFKPGALYSLDFDEFKSVPDTLEQVEVLRWDLLIMSPDNDLWDRVNYLLGKINFPYRLTRAILERYNINSWPSGISGTQLQYNEEKKILLKKYICRRIPSVLSCNQEEAVIVFAFDNTHMPADMIAHPGFLMAFKPGALYSLDFDEFKSVPDTLEQVKVLRWDLLIMSPDNDLWDRVDYLLGKIDFPYRLTRAILERYNINSWPSGISGTQLQYNEEKKILLNKYICRRIPGVLSDNKEEALIVFASDNTHMPPDMIVEPGLLMIFNPVKICLSNVVENILLSPFTSLTLK